jgi:PTH1 family peptidyl-tRNA hydrolase
VKLLVGLGNPGPGYAGTRHNVGFRVLDALASRHGIAIHSESFAGHFGQGVILGTEVGLLKPMTFMNRSGGAVTAALSALPQLEFARDLILVYDDLDLPFGRLRLRARGGAGGHRGVADVIDALASSDFARLRFGIGRPPDAGPTIEHVLEEFSPAEEIQLVARIDMAVQALEACIVDGVGAAMSGFNSEPAPGD